MSRVKVKDIGYSRYYTITIRDEYIENACVNMMKLYEFIGKNNCSRHDCGTPIGNAYEIIRRKASNKLGYRKRYISKRMVRSLVICFGSRITNSTYIRIPFLVDKIFESIFEIYDETKKRVEPPQEIKQFVGQFRANIFYREQINEFNESNWHDGANERLRRLYHSLHDDLNADDSTIWQVF